MTNSSDNSEELQHLLAKSISKKGPISSAMLQTLVVSMLKTLLPDIQLAPAALMACAAYLWNDELA